jgi:hypothetical protein
MAEVGLPLDIFILKSKATAYLKYSRTGLLKDTHLLNTYIYKYTLINDIHSSVFFLINRARPREKGPYVHVEFQKETMDSILACGRSSGHCP